MKVWMGLLLAAMFYVQANSKPLKPGDKIPDIVIMNLMNASQTAVTLQSLKGKVIVLDFWATWCVPCVKAFPKMAAIQKQYSKEVQVIAVSNESPDRIGRFIKNRPLDLWFASDTATASLLKQSFPHISLPHVVIIDKEGVVRAITNGNEVTDDVIKQVVNGITPNVSFKNETVTEGEVFETVTDGKEQFILKGFQQGVRPSKNINSNSITYVNTHFSRIYLDAWQMNYSRLRYQDIDQSEQRRTNETLYSLQLTIKENNYTKLLETLQQKLQQEFIYKSKVDKEKDTVFVLSKIGDPDTSMIKKANSTRSSGTNKGKFYARNQSIGAAIANYLEGFGIVDGIVLDETGDTKLHDISFEWEPEKEGAIEEFLQKLGLKMERAIREYDVLVIYK